jgi:4,5-dihydroxyphthalate decarboxylase
VALPVFASRVFIHGFIIVNRRRVIAARELAGKRVGVPLYAQTSAIFPRGLMQHDLGIDLSGIEWVQGAVNEAGIKPVKITPNTTGRSLSDLLEAGIHGRTGAHRGADSDRRANVCLWPKADIPRLRSRVRFQG